MRQKFIFECMEENIKQKHLTSLGNVVRTKRLEKGISQTALANTIGKDQPSLNRLERGKINPSYLYLIEVCNGLNISLSELLVSLEDPYL